MPQSTSWLNAEHLDHELVRRGLTLKRFADRSGIRVEELSRLRTRRTPLTPTMQRRLAAALARIPLAEGCELVSR
jgi:transcriptional regulator with XRE-family HTH domain